ncbi:pre-mRNA-splicing factor 38A isoform X1 [Scophthalmus maximus]|uniref:pre-mRNA-splicing factor 38A isoform X1 n=1 Tax=Scophthalmus maximus TaxID=52904 RepID=UPI001FA91F5A|nr:pre-mRNA-splicing factor 38A isoform X1 [Scophthalmus maximus]
MANRTVKDANSIHGTNPQYLVEKIIRTRIYESKYWKEECFGLTAELVVDKAMELRFVGGVYGGNIKPTPFLCLTLKMLQIQPEKDIIVEFIKNEDFKYVRLLGAMYMRLTGTAVDCYKYLEPLYNDYRKVKSQNRNGEFELMHVDEFIDDLLHAERMCDIILPRLQVLDMFVTHARTHSRTLSLSRSLMFVCMCVLQKRQVLEEAEMLDTRISALEEDLDEVESSEEEDEEEEKPERLQTPEPHRRSYRDNDRPRRSPSPRYRRSRSPRRRSRSPKRRSPSPRRERHRSKSPRRHRSRSRERRHRSKSPGHHRSHRHRSHSKTPERSSKKSHKKSRRNE